MNLVIPEINKNQLEERIESIKKQAQETVKMYSGLTDPNDMKDAKAKLNNFVKDADDIRKNTTRSLDEAKKALKGSVDEATEEPRELAAHYKEQLDEIEEQRKSEKRAEIESLDGAETFLKHYAFNDKWLNKGTTIDAIQEEINEGVAEIQNNVESIETMASALDLDAQPYIVDLQTKKLSEITQQMKRDKALIDARLKREQEKPARPEVKEQAKTFAFKRLLTGKPTDVKDYIKEVERLAIEYGIEIKKEEE